MRAWEQFLTQVAHDCGNATVDRWLKGLTILSHDSKNLYLEAHDSFQINWFEEHIRPRLQILSDIHEGPICVHVTLKGESIAKGRSTAKEKHTSKTGKKALNSALPQHTLDASAPVDPSCTFDTWVTSKSNLVPLTILEESCITLAHRKLAALGAPPPVHSSGVRELANPIYLWGGPGGGKTHLLMAMAQRLKMAGYQTIYTRAHLFTEHMVRAIRSGDMAHFRTFYRQAEVLLIDDIHLLGRKHTTQEEFFHTFNTLHTAGKLLIFSANCPANALQHIEARLVSRFEWGISLPIEPLGTKDLIKLLEKKAAYFKVPITARVAEFLTQTFAANAALCVKALETLLVRTQLTKNGPRQPPINVARAQELLADLIEEAGASILTAEQIISCVAGHFGIGEEELMSASQQRGVLIPRQLAMYLIRQRLKTPYVKIGDLFSRDHSTVISACNQVQKLLKAHNTQITSSLQAINLKLSRKL